MLQENTSRMNQEDRPEWMWSKNKLFTVTSCYTVITYRGRMDETAKVIWETQAPTKIHAFMWLLGKNTILMWDDLQRRGWVGPGRCSLYQSALLDSAYYIFISCEYTMSIWMHLNVGGKLIKINELKEIWQQFRNKNRNIDSNIIMVYMDETKKSHVQ